MRQRYVSKSIGSQADMADVKGVAVAAGDPFVSAEEAWFWFVRCQCARLQGARFEPGRVETQRPCDPDDLYRAVMGLHRARRLGGDHLRVLGVFGLREQPPDPRRPEEELPSRLWDEALDLLTTVLKAKGIVA